MSDTMLHGVLNMPTELWSNDFLDEMQRHGRYVEASELIQSLTADNARQSKEITLLREVLDRVAFALTPQQEVSDG